MPQRDGHNHPLMTKLQLALGSEEHDALFEPHTHQRTAGYELVLSQHGPTATEALCVLQVAWRSVVHDS